MSNFHIPSSLKKLSEVYRSMGHELWLVGGCVRDCLIGLPWKDIDLSTSATPDEQIAIYEGNGYRWIPTGIDHGTITVMIDGEPYEVTTFRSDVETDGRHAVTVYTRDLIVDLERRDLTINAIAMDFDGQTLVDPFDGQNDLSKGIVRFVGDADKRIQEDYLRILRWFRFLGRFSSEFTANSIAAKAITRHGAGLKKISVERIWSEFSKILTGPNAASVIRLMNETGVTKEIGIKNFNADSLENLQGKNVTSAGRLAAGVGSDAIRITTAWKMSNQEAETVRFVSDRLQRTYDEIQAKRDLVEGKTLQNVVDVLIIQNQNETAEKILTWQVPTFPVTGKDLKESGYSQGKALGQVLKSLKEEWIVSEYTKDKDTLLRSIARV